ncbi:hypothetical protein DM02DRAFT_659422 [Periconia macrospinosa]|uniref:AMP-dependent synthetase/ligase domain-containing protein n=1 Tax=Periconia macrospinosa TaxID=97972 RepID=A0A2V1DDU4_9PLEO|nr:hypothetical protein DM02DRAFT_659422 [Periconia macrospinosa]
MTALLQGSCICVPSEENRMADLATAMRKFHVTWALFTPSIVTLICPEDVLELNVSVLGGEAVSKANARTWATKKTLIVGYGPSETCVVSSAAIITNPQQNSG